MEATSPVLSSLIRKRADLSGEANALTARLAEIGASVTHLDAVIGLFDPSFDLASIRPKRPRDPSAAKPGEISRFVLDALRGGRRADRDASLDDDAYEGTRHGRG